VDQYCRGIWAELWFGNAMASVRAINGWPVGFWGLWCPSVVEVVVVVGRIGYAEVMVADDEGYCYVVEVLVDDEECGCAVVAEVG
jgi:hypothetical protein